MKVLMNAIKVLKLKSPAQFKIKSVRTHDSCVLVKNAEYKHNLCLFAINVPRAPLNRPGFV